MLWRWSRSTAILALLAVTACVAHADDQTDATSRADATAWIGVALASGDVDAATGARGVRIGSVEPEGPADRAGVRSGDLVTQVDGRAVREPDALVQAIRAQSPGKQFRLTIVRDGQTKSLEVEAEAPPEDAFAGTLENLVRTRRMGAPRLGIEVLALDADLAAYFSTKAGEGVLVTRVVPQSGAADAGVKSGDVVLRVDGTAVADIDDLHAILQPHAAGDRLDVALLRHGRAETLQVEVGDSDLAAGFDPLRRWSGHSMLSRNYVDNTELQSLRRELLELKRDMDELKRDLRSRH